MPYKNERASKGGHSDIVKNPDISSFLLNCDYMKEPSTEEASGIISLFEIAPTSNSLPFKIVASDASVYSKPINGKFPSTQIGYVKVSLVLIDTKNYNELTTTGSRYIDPFKAAALHRNADSISFVLPGSNVKYKGASTILNGFRRAVWEQLSDDRTKLSKEETYSVKGTLFALNAIDTLTVKTCPSCGHQPNQKFSFSPSCEILTCPNCQENIYFTDTLRIHEQISDFGDNSSAITRFMNVIEHLITATLIRMLADQQPAALSEMAFIMDGPLAIFGQPARVHSRLMSLYYKIAKQLEDKNLLPPIIIGLQKDGQLMEHARSVEHFLVPNTYKVVDDNYRIRYIGSSSQGDNFGHETYYGQDFIFKTESGRIFTVGLPYPMAEKGAKQRFSEEKVNMELYKAQLGRAFDVIRHFEFDLYENAIVPVALAHRHASISLIPGGKILDLFSKNGLGSKH